ncbi:hypothetical protein C8T65DRAFT_664156 [Cerioporus squamosus]|nr:hypothetical protein C8T65DRAFT_664156 [Cerioporus squamosus]
MRKGLRGEKRASCMIGPRRSGGRARVRALTVEVIDDRERVALPESAPSLQPGKEPPVAALHNEAEEKEGVVPALLYRWHVRAVGR